MQGIVPGAGGDPNPPDARQESLPATKPAPARPPAFGLEGAALAFAALRAPDPDSWVSSGDSAVHLLRPPADFSLGPAEDDFTALPEVGHTFLGFHLLAELGRGTFGRVYLGRQGDLANRLVALKVSTQTQAESQKLAQLQHTHIVPVYSLHQSGPLFAVCMPY